MRSDRKIVRVIGFVVLAAVWELAARSMGSPMFPPFLKVFPALVDLFLSGEIKDGQHRWGLSKDKKIYALTDGMIPVVVLRNKTRGEEMLSTIRYNRARGVHGVLPMAEIVSFLHDDEGMEKEEIATRLGMDQEEIARLLMRGKMSLRGGREGGEFGKGWAPNIDETLRARREMAAAANATELAADGNTS